MTSTLLEMECLAIISRFLVVTSDQQLSFREYVRMLCLSIFSRVNLLRTFECTTWAWHTTDRRQIYIAVVRSLNLYTAAVLGT